jgi:uncharacterized coiled-coil DUF342 family protein
MSVRVQRKMCTIFKRTDEEKKLHNMSKELVEAQEKLASTTKELNSTKKQLKSLTSDIEKIKEALAVNDSSEEESK